MHTTSIQSYDSLRVEPPNSWCHQIGKSLILVGSSIGFGWLINRLWKGANIEEMNRAGGDHQIAIYRREHRGYSESSIEFLSASPADSDVLKPLPQTLFQRVGISYDDAMWAVEEEPKFVFATGIRSFPMLPASFLIASLLTSGRTQQPLLTPLLVSCLALSMPRSVEAGWSLGDLFYPKSSIKDSLEEAGYQARITLDKLDGVITATMQKVGALEDKFMVDLGKTGKMFIQETGNELRITADGIAKNTQATLRVAGYEARFTIAAAGQEARAVVEYIGEEVRLTIQEAKDATREIIGHTSKEADRLMVNFGKEAQLVIEKAGDTFTTSTNKAMDKFFSKSNEAMDAAFSKSEALLKLGGKEVRLSIEALGSETRLTIKTAAQETKEVIDHTQEALDVLLKGMPDIVGRIEKEIVLELFNEIKNGFWGKNEFQRLLQDVQKNIRDSDARRGDKQELVSRLLMHVKKQSQGSLSSLEKANLYIELINCVNQPSIRDPDKQLLFFLIAATAFHDTKLTQRDNYYGLYPTTTNYFNDVLLRELPDARVAGIFLKFLNSQTDAGKTACSDYIEELSKFSNLADKKLCSLEATDNIQLSDNFTPSDKFIVPLATILLTGLLARVCRGGFSLGSKRKDTVINERG